ncbi:MAG TPA: hypothetical protein VGR54_02800 [Nitrosopumilaceae archaeon]|nr:hypothetical protein [Nitrosopumilaceae archaeon]
MGKIKKIGIGIGIAILSFFVLAIVVAVVSQTNNPNSSLPTSLPDNGPQIENANNIIGISEFVVVQQGSIYQAHFSLTGTHAEQLSSDAQVSFVVKRDDGSTVYTQNLDVKQSDFQTYQRFTGASFLAYLWQFDGQKIPHGQYEILKAHLMVTLPNGKTYQADTSVL